MEASKITYLGNRISGWYLKGFVSQRLYPENYGHEAEYQSVNSRPPQVPNRVEVDHTAAVQLADTHYNSYSRWYVSTNRRIKVIRAPAMDLQQRSAAIIITLRAASDAELKWDYN